MWMNTGNGAWGQTLSAIFPEAPEQEHGIESSSVMYQLAVSQGCLLPQLNLLHTLAECEALEYSTFVRQKITDKSNS